ncbi:hypothetical protein M1N07_01880, partial [Thermodesulfovibrionales bacterium]|nr:hypothetical protein [Thermodesulfovibrionales bacterium]
RERTITILRKEVVIIRSAGRIPSSVKSTSNSRGVVNSGKSSIIGCIGEGIGEGIGCVAAETEGASKQQTADSM